MSTLCLVLLVLAQPSDEVETADGDILFPVTPGDVLPAPVESPPVPEGPPLLSPVSFGGYLDFGFFIPFGTGVGVRQDFGNAAFPELAGQYAWVFYGDLLAPAVNTRGEAADLGELAGSQRFDSVHSRGAPGFIVNEVNLRAQAAVGGQLLLLASVNLMPRTGSQFALGDVFEVDLAQLEWMPTDDRRTSIFVGKMESLLGVEYRQRKAHTRFGVTPSLIARYTTGTPLGFKVRSKLFKGDLLTLALAFTNGSSTTEQFHFYDEIDSNAGKTVSGRISLKPFGPFENSPLGELELGVSGEWGPQDRALDSGSALWFVGVDLLWHKGRVDVEAQWLRGLAPGRALDQVYALQLNHGAYLTVAWRITSLVGVLVRGELRDAFVSLGDERAYLTRSFRVTAGARLSLNEHVTLKAEYLFNGEYGGVPAVPNDVFTSSLVLAY
ncbi:MAG: hypothetical protein Q8L48_21705 [Archangium sp.]|nr:hypothetical protein [Archangium sp.]